MTNERDDEILGRALSRAIETLDAPETPYDGSRIGAPPVKRGTSFWRLSALAASILIAGALGSLLLDRPARDEPVGVQPSATVAPTHTPAATATPVATPTPKATAIDHALVYFARDGLPPVGVHSDKIPSGGAPADRISERLFELLAADPGMPAPAGAFTARPARGAIVGVNDVKLEGDLATVGLRIPEGFKISGSAATTALVQQIVYTTTEEPGIRRVLLTVNGRPATIDQLVWDKPLTRDDVSGYGPQTNEVIAEDQSRPCTPNCPSPVPARLSNNYSVDTFAAGVARFIVQVDSGDWESFTVSGGSSDDTKVAWSSKYALQIKVKGTEIKPGLEIIDRSPLRAIQSATVAGSTTYELALDDQRPWRVALLPNPDRIVVDIGGFPRALSDTVAVYSPKPGDIGRQFTVTGLSRTYEATTQWRVVDSARREVASGFTTASRGTSAVWGTYQISVQLPATVSGNVTLEVYWGSPRDGSEVGLVQVPLTVR